MANEELLTEKDRIAYSAIVKFIKEHGYSPYVRELCRILGKSSTATIQYRLNSLGKKGFIKTSSGEKRTIQITSEIKEIPTVEAVEVVRCKDCKHWKLIDSLNPHRECQIFYGLHEYGYLTSADDFCSYGERKDNA